MAAARLAENHLSSRMALRDEVFRARNLAHLAGLGDAPGALLSARGRVLAAQPLGWVSDRVVLPHEGDRVVLGEDTEAVLEPLAEGYLLRVLRPAAGVGRRCRCRSSAPTARSCGSTGARCG